MPLKTAAVIVLALFSLCNTVRTSSEESDDEWEPDGYYWRDYKGVIPKDALPCGRNAHGNTTYAGQVLHQNQIIPAKIDPEQQKVTYEWGYLEYVAHENIKILCTRDPDQFEWVNTGNQHINTVKDKNWVVGGYEAGAIGLLIGRKEIDGELVVGKVIYGPNQATLNTTKDGKGIQHASYQVLAYSPKKGKPNKSTTASSTDVQLGNKTKQCKLRHKTIVINFYN